MSFTVRQMRPEHVSGAVRLQKLAFPPPFSEDLHWDSEHLFHHIDLFPEGQFVAVSGDQVIGSCSNTIIDEEHWAARGGWYRTVGGPDLEAFDSSGTTLYGLDITVHPDFRRQGVGRAFYQTRFDLVKTKGLLRYGTGCRIPNYSVYRAKHSGITTQEYAEAVVAGLAVDRTLTPLLRYGLRFICVIPRYMPDEESDDAGALLEWMP
ncbi:MAG TPA: GNAT family N-acetyltransferase [Fimbriimonas sp.]|nr:GNAT family N-acetyltransferase [Fimbriimonas sp.]